MSEQRDRWRQLESMIYGEPSWEEYFWSAVFFLTKWVSIGACFGIGLKVVG